MDQLEPYLVPYKITVFNYSFEQTVLLTGDVVQN